MKSSRITIIASIAAFLMLTGFTCQVQAPTLLQEVGTPPPSLPPRPILRFRRGSPTLSSKSTAPGAGSTTEKIDSCVALALTQYQARCPTPMRRTRPSSRPSS